MLTSCCLSVFIFSTLEVLFQMIIATGVPETSQVTFRVRPSMRIILAGKGLMEGGTTKKTQLVARSIEKHTF